MRAVLYLLVVGSVISGGCRPGEPKEGSISVQGKHADGQRIAKVVEAGCGMCIFGLADASCELAVKIDAKVYRVEGSKLDDHGDAHAADGMCMVSRQAYVEGRIDGEKFIAKRVELQR